MQELESLQSIFKDRIFKIPDYQRGYAWTTRQLKDFWEDIVNLPSERYHSGHTYVNFRTFALLFYIKGQSKQLLISRSSYK